MSGANLQNRGSSFFTKSEISEKLGKSSLGIQVPGIQPQLLSRILLKIGSDFVKQMECLKITRLCMDYFMTLRGIITFVSEKVTKHMRL